MLLVKFLGSRMGEVRFNNIRSLLVRVPTVFGVPSITAVLPRLLNPERGEKVENSIGYYHTVICGKKK